MIHKEKDQFQLNLEKEVLSRIKNIVQEKIPQALEQKEKIKSVGVEEAIKELLTILSSASGGVS